MQQLMQHAACKYSMWIDLAKAKRRRKEKKFFERSQKVDLEIKKPCRLQFWPFNVANLLKRSLQEQFGPATAPTGILNWGGPPLAACPKKKVSLSYCYAPICTALRPSRPASKPASKPAPSCFVLISMVLGRS